MVSLALTSSCNLGFRSIPLCRSRSAKSPPLNLKSQFHSHQNRISSCPNPLSKQLLGALPSNIFLKLQNCSLSLSNRKFTVRASAASAAPVAPASEPWHGAALKPLMASIATGIIHWFVPVPNGVAKNACQLLAIFLATIVGIITQPLPLGAVALMGLGASVLTKTLTFAAAFSAFGDPIPWLIALAFFFARGFYKDWTCNAGDGTENRLGAWLMLTCFQTSVVSSSMFLTAMAANPLSANLTYNTIKQSIGWTDLAKAAIVPGLISLLVVPN
ncbi:PREDICTED: dicarboxylate transporter 1, chloroplastic-like [Nelumbo nucifera]|uniref:Dicarboxylate transporter 1, chloroplastic-like n=1 Tax=Nelumbo nucifera TaxID=4432 RepID=A0A1U8QCF9_NELNU|nr:PREDICTED: dicarboxylate transporter 1, chloroplastic-like [Nelumbo nucifera]